MGCQESTQGGGTAAASPVDESAPLDHAVVIIGAGAAGLGCARRLQERGIKDVLVLEARERHGGRMHTVSTLHGPLDLGAAWIHGIKGAPMRPACMDSRHQRCTQHEQQRQMLSVKCWEDW